MKSNLFHQEITKIFKKTTANYNNHKTIKADHMLLLQSINTNPALKSLIGKNGFWLSVNLSPHLCKCPPTKDKGFLTEMCKKPVYWQIIFQIKIHKESVCTTNQEIRTSGIHCLILTKQYAWVFPRLINTFDQWHFHTIVPRFVNANGIVDMFDQY